MEALLVIEPPNIVPPSENAVGTAVILDFFTRHKPFVFLRKNGMASIMNEKKRNKN